MVLLCVALALHAQTLEVNCTVTATNRKPYPFFVCIRNKMLALVVLHEYLVAPQELFHQFFEVLSMEKRHPRTASGHDTKALRMKSNGLYVICACSLRTLWLQ